MQSDLSGGWQHVEVKPPDLPVQQLCIEQRVSSIDSRLKIVTEDAVDDEVDEIDEDALLKPTAENFTRLLFDITLSETYQVPILHFRFQRNGKTVWPSIEQVYRALVPSVYSSQLASTGVMGGISMTNHPVDGGPTFFVHPCRTADALQSSASATQLTTFQYLQLWFGIIGGPIGLAIPSELLMVQSEVSGSFTVD